MSNSEESMHIVPSAAGEAEIVDSDYSHWEFANASVRVRIHREVIEGIRREIQEKPEAISSGTFRGERTGGEPVDLQVDQYRRSESEGIISENEAREALGIYFTGAKAPSYLGNVDFLLQIMPDAEGTPVLHCFGLYEDGSLTPLQPVTPTAQPATPPEEPKHRRLVPDFDPAELPRSLRSFDAEPDHAAAPNFLQQHWKAFLAALVLVGGVLGLTFYLQNNSLRTPGGKSASVAETSPAVRPLGLHVDPTVPVWRVTWNHDASAEQGRKGIRLFVQDGGEQTLVELSPQNLDTAQYEFQPQSRDVTFRLEATAADGRVTAESFRVLTPEPAKAAEPQAPAPTAAAFTAPKPVHRVPPVVDASMRPRIHGKIRLDVRAEIDSHGRVISAKPARKSKSRLETYLYGRAVRAAMEWRFEPATKQGTPTASAQTIHFVFER